MIAAISGLALLIIMFLFDWFGIGGVAGEALEQAEEFGFATDVDVGANAWDSLEVIRFLLLITGLVALGLGIGAAMSQSVALPVAGSALTAGLGILSVIFIAYRILDPPSEASREIGVFLGLLAAGGVAYGGWMAMQEEGTSFTGEADRVGDQVGGGPGDTAAPPPSEPAAQPPSEPAAPPPSDPGGPPPGGPPPRV